MDTESVNVTSVKNVAVLEQAALPNKDVVFTSGTPPF